jgi:hypothetical protein
MNKIAKSSSCNSFLIDFLFRGIFKFHILLRRVVSHNMHPELTLTNLLDSNLEQFLLIKFYLAFLWGSEKSPFNRITNFCVFKNTFNRTKSEVKK